MNDIKYENNNYKFIYRVSALIYNFDESKLLLFYGNDMKHYMLPGGKVKEFEISEDAIKREIKEEIGNNNFKFTFVGVSEELVNKKENKIHIITFIYKCKYNEVIKENEFKSKESEWINFKWVNIKNLHKYNIKPNANNIEMLLSGENHIVEKDII